MKWLATFSGELTNSATYPSSFANVKQDDVKNVNGTFGEDSTCTWKPWSYDQRIKVAKLVDTVLCKGNENEVCQNSSFVFANFL